MAKRYSEIDKRLMVSAYLSSGQSLASYSRQCGVSSITLKSWRQKYTAGDQSGFVALSQPIADSAFGFRLIFGGAVLDFHTLPPVEWVSDILKSMSK